MISFKFHLLSQSPDSLTLQMCILYLYTIHVKYILFYWLRRIISVKRCNPTFCSAIECHIYCKHWNSIGRYRSLVVLFWHIFMFQWNCFISIIWHSFYGAGKILSTKKQKIKPTENKMWIERKERKTTFQSFCWYCRVFQWRLLQWIQFQCNM